MKTLYLMRHGQTLFNKLNRKQGWCDSPLTELGIKQAGMAGQYFKDNHIELKSAYCSTSERTSDTLELVSDLPYTRLKGLKEWNFGLFEGQPEYLNPPLPYGDFFVKHGGEEEEEVKERIAQTLKTIMLDEKNETILVVSHGGACRQFMRYWEHTSDVRLEGGLPNCCILKFEFNEEEFKLIEIVSHDFSGIITE